MRRTINTYLAAFVVTVAGSIATLGIVDLGTSHVLSAILYTPHEHGTTLYAAVRAHRITFSEH